MTTIDKIMALVNALEEQNYLCAQGEKSDCDKAREALRTEMTKALANKQAQEPIPSIRKTMNTWEKNVLGKLNPSHFGIPQEYCEAAQSYAEFFHSNKLDSVRVSAHALQDLAEIFGGEK